MLPALIAFDILGEAAWHPFIGDRLRLEFWEKRVPEVQVPRSAWSMRSWKCPVELLLGLLIQGPG